MDICMSLRCLFSPSSLLSSRRLGSSSIMKRSLHLHWFIEGIATEIRRGQIRAHASSLIRVIGDVIRLEQDAPFGWWSLQINLRRLNSEVLTRDWHALRQIPRQN